MPTKKCVVCGATKFVFGKKVISTTYQQWLDVVGKTRLKNSEGVCKDHFTTDCFENYGSWKHNNSSGVSTRLVLKETAVPSMQLEQSSAISEVAKSTVMSTEHPSRMYRQNPNTPSSKTALLKPAPNSSQTTSILSKRNMVSSDVEDELFPAVRKDGKRKPETPLHSTPKKAAVDTTVVTDMSMTSEPANISEYQPSFCSEQDSTLSSIGSENCDEFDKTIVRENNSRPQLETKVPVFWSALEPLLRICPHCPARGNLIKLKATAIGAAVTVQRHCTECCTVSVWRSSPLRKRKWTINLLQSCAILFTGLFPSKVTRLFNAMGLLSIARQTFTIHQSEYLHQAITTYYNKLQKETYRLCRERQLIVAGDARCDSMGHCAKYGSYSLMDVETGRILTTQLIQVTEVANSNAMEMEGLKRCLADLAKQYCSPSTLITDRHPQIRKYMRETYGEARKDRSNTYIKHLFDAWHVVKSLKKDLEKAVKNDKSGLIGEWKKSVITHVYWCASSTPSGDRDEIEAKYLSLLNHVTGVHRHRSTKFPKCLHEKRKRGQKKKNYFILDSPEHQLLCEVMESPRRIADIRQLSVLGQTSALEAYHALVNHFAPKMYHFSYKGMKSRLLLATIHTNRNAEAKQKDVGQLSVFYPKAKRGDHSIKKKKKPSSYEYIWELMDEALLTVPEDSLENDPEPMNKKFKKSTYEEEQIISKYQSRFKW